MRVEIKTKSTTIKKEDDTPMKKTNLSHSTLIVAFHAAPK